MANAFWAHSFLPRTKHQHVEGQTVSLEEFLKKFSAAHPSWLQMWGSVGTAGLAILVTSVGGSWTAASQVMSGKLQYVREDVQELKKDVKDLNQNVHVIRTDVASMKQEQQKLHTDVASIKQDVRALHEGLSDNQELVTDKTIS